MPYQVAKLRKIADIRPCATAFFRRMNVACEFVRSRLRSLLFFLQNENALKVTIDI